MDIHLRKQNQVIYLQFYFFLLTCPSSDEEALYLSVCIWGSPIERSVYQI